MAREATGHARAGGAPILRAENLAIGYRAGRGGKEMRVLSGIDLELLPGEMVCLLGPNGAGKSTLLRTLGGLQEPLEGRLWAGGRDFASMRPGERARLAAIVLTERADAGNLSVYSLAALGRHPHTGWSGRMGEADRAAVRRGLEEAGAWELRERPCEELSDGERQRVMLARALAQEPSLLLLDEPTAFLDLPRRVEAMRVLRTLARERGRAVLLSTHDLDLALRAADRIWLLPPGGPLQSGLPEDLAISGAFGSVFDRGDVSFDHATGLFRVHGHPDRRARITGDPLPAFWAARALEREGYAAAEGGHADVTVTAAYREGRPYWEIPEGPARGIFSTLEGLTRALRP